MEQWFLPQKAFRKHQQVDPLIAPGSADLTADVDFTYLRNSVIDRALTYGPVSQSYFLKQMGIDLRLKVSPNAVVNSIKINAYFSKFRCACF